MPYNFVPDSFHTGVTAEALREKIYGKSAILHQCGHFGLTNRAKMIGGGRPLVPKILDQSDRVGAKSPIFDLFLLVAPQP